MNAINVKRFTPVLSHKSLAYLHSLSHTFHSSEYALERKQHSRVLRAFSSCNRSVDARLALEKLSTSFSSLTAAAVCCVRAKSTAAKAKPLLVEINFKMKIHEFHFAFGGVYEMDVDFSEMK